MRLLLVQRHAHAPAAAGLPDHARPLDAAGVAAARASGERLRREGFVPQAIVCSTAARAEHTAEEVARASGARLAIDARRELYDGGVARYRAVLGELDDEVRVALVVGHNPSVEELVLWLTGRRCGFRPGALARVECAIDAWPDLAPPATLAALWD